MKQGGKKHTKPPLSLLLVEGETDEIFYNRIKAVSLPDCRAVVQNMKGLYNINQKIVDKIFRYLQEHRDERIRVYCCFDRESQYGEVPGFDLKWIKKRLKELGLTKTLSVDEIIATKQIESWFFYDINNIFVYLKVPRSKRNAKRYTPCKKYGYKDLQKLFEKNGKTYSKGNRAKPFIKKLNINKVVESCEELGEGVKLIKSQANDLTNHLFPSRKRKKK